MKFKCQFLNNLIKIENVNDKLTRCSMSVSEQTNRLLSYSYPTYSTQTH